MLKILRNLALLILLLAGVLKLLLWYMIKLQIETAAEHLLPLGMLRYDTVSVELSGNVNLTGVSFTPQQNSLREPISATHVALQTPDLIWLLKHALLNNHDVPNRLGITIEGLQIPANLALLPSATTTLSLRSYVPFETLGCGVVSHFSEHDYEKMGLTLNQQTQHVEYHYQAATNTLEFNINLDNSPLSSINLHTEFSQVGPETFSLQNALEKWRIVRATIAYNDTGYLKQRNKFCAQHIGLRPEQFADKHIEAILGFLKERHIEPNAELIALYRRLVNNGGELMFSSLPNSGVIPAEYAHHEPADILRLMNLTARYNNAPPILVRLTFLPSESSEETPTTLIDTEVKLTPAAPASIKPEPVTPSPEPAHNSEKSLPIVTAKAPSPIASTITPSTNKPAVPPTSTPVVTISKSNKATAAVIAPSASSPATSSNKATASKNSVPDLDRVEALLPSAPPEKLAPEISPSASPPPPNSTLALVWQGPKIERLPAPPSQTQDYDVIGIETLNMYIGKRIRLITYAGKNIEGYVLSTDATGVELQVNEVSGTAKFTVPNKRIKEVQLLRGITDQD